MPVSDPLSSPTLVSATHYGPFGQRVVEIDQIAAVRDRLEPQEVLWIRVRGLRDRAPIDAIAAAVQMHPLALEDVMHTHQRAKLEDYGDHAFLVVRLPALHDGVGHNQAAWYFGTGFLVSFEETHDDLFAPVRERVERGIGRIRKDGTDYLCYALLDTAIDAWFPVMEKAGDRLDALEAEIADRPREHSLSRVYELKRDVSNLRRVVSPLRDLANRLSRGEFDQVDDTTRVFFRDCHDHVAQLIDQIDQLRETAMGLMELHVSIISNRMNDVMRVLTVISTIFIPLTFLVGVYGMNFDPDVSPYNMPELRSRYGYPAVLLVMAATAIGLYLWFWRRGWIRMRR
jgi:magnesium transporter